MTYNKLTTQNDLSENPSPRCLCMVVLDTSSSMSGNPIALLNESIKDFLKALNEDEVTACSVEVGVITADSSVDEELPITSALNINGRSSFSAGGMASLGSAVNLALQKLEDRKAEYKHLGVPYYQPWLIIISDGKPNDNWHAAAAKTKQLSAQNKLVSLVVGVEGANLAILNEFSDRPAVKLQGLKFNEFFQWLSASMSRVSQSASTTTQVDLPPKNGWAGI